MFLRCSGASAMLSFELFLRCSGASAMLSFALFLRCFYVVSALFLRFVVLNTLIYISCLAFPSRNLPCHSAQPYV